MAHPFDADIVTAVAEETRITEETLNERLTTVSQSMMDDCEDLINAYKNKYDDDPTVDDPVLATHPDRITFLASGIELRDTLDMEHIEHTHERNAVEDVFKQQAVRSGLETERISPNFALTTWKPVIREYVRGGLTVQEARAQVLRAAGYSQEEIQTELELDTKSAAKNALYRGDRKIKEAKQLVSAADAEEEVV